MHSVGGRLSKQEYRYALLIACRWCFVVNFALTETFEFISAPAGRGSGRKSRRSLADELPSPSPSRKSRRVEGSPGSSDLQPLPSSPPMGQDGEAPLFSSPQGKCLELGVELSCFNQCSCVVFTLFSVKYRKLKRDNLIQLSGLTCKFCNLSSYHPYYKKSCLLCWRQDENRAQKLFEMANGSPVWMKEPSSLNIIICISFIFCYLCSCGCYSISQVLSAMVRCWHQLAMLVFTFQVLLTSTWAHHWTTAHLSRAA